MGITIYTKYIDFLIAYDKYSNMLLVIKNMTTWQDVFVDNKVDLSTIKYGKSWKKMFEQLYTDKRIKNRIEKELSKELENDKNVLIYPYPKLLYNAFQLTSFEDTKVVILGQDPYFNYEIHDNEKIPQAMGLSFSVPNKFKIPSSLANIYKNLKKFGHIDTIPTHGNLENWALQGCLLLNTALTVKDGQKNCHQFIWNWFTDGIIDYISKNTEHVVFVLWGGNAFEKTELIDKDKHKMIISSHPSGLSANRPMKEYLSFNSEDHFGKINEQLIKWKYMPINWKL
ncbi:uracil-DNA glycosylase-like [Bodo saltans virus]|uniref:Uracil-DNA glycosylase-like n=1 Tax=Bodo saltans virus TaxID=2024608 RepID=A0A2H4UTY1_9VIRU|nr:uracil-DNA glycosylase-like [Bodo saltans virus]ATZ80403.1 uracil-DNA glycosylase-like [Bodo saltans virus]